MLDAVLEGLPELFEQRDPLLLSSGNGIEFVFQFCCEVIVDILGEIVCQELFDDTANVSRDESFLVNRDVFAILECRYDGCIGRGPANAVLLERLDEACLVVARRRLGKVLFGADCKQIDLFAFLQGRQQLLIPAAPGGVILALEIDAHETGFRDGTTSTAYKALKLIGETFGSEAAEKKILFVGAGDIVRQLFKYNSKFRYPNIFVTNRTESRAEKLARAHNVKTFSWERLTANDLSEFDVIISAVSHASGIIHKGLATDKNVLLIDLAVPGNFAPALASDASVLLQDLDSISCQLKSNREARRAAIENVEEIIAQQWSEYRKWQEMQPFRNLMARRKKQVHSALGRIGIAERYGWSMDEVTVLVDQIMRKILKKPETLQYSRDLEVLVAQYAALQAA